MERLVALFILLTATPAFVSQSPQPPPVIVVQGEATVRRTADRAVVTIGAQARASKPGEAQRQADDAMRAVIEALKNTGISDDDIHTGGYSVGPDVDRSKVRGYAAETQIEVRVDNVANVPKVLEAVGASGASMSRLEFELKDRKAVEEEALRLAVQSAMRRARVAAEGAGVELGPIVRLGEQQRFESGSAGADASGAGAIQVRLVHTSSGEIEVRVQVSLSVSVR